MHLVQFGNAFMRLTYSPGHMPDYKVGANLRTDDCYNYGMLLLLL